jgi:hypothetical protein
MTKEEARTTSTPMDAPGFRTVHPVQLPVEQADRYSRGLAILGIPLFIGRMIALIPVFIILEIVGYVAILVAWLLQFVVLLSGRYPKGAHGFVTGYVRWSLRRTAWLRGLNDTYPGLRMKP